MIGPGFIGSNSKKVGEDLEVLFGIEASLDLIFLDDNKTGIGFELSHFDAFPGGDWIVSVYDTSDNVIGIFTVPDAIEPAKQFFGVWCATPIGRINIWDPDIAPDAVDNIQMYFDQEPACPWDCGDQNKIVDTVDFLALLAQWGLVGTPCDFNNDGVDTVDFLKLLAAWGPCPAPINDECPGAIKIDRFGVNDTIIEHFDMYGATPSPETPKCQDVLHQGHLVLPAQQHEPGQAGLDLVHRGPGDRGERRLHVQPDRAADRLRLRRCRHPAVPDGCRPAGAHPPAERAEPAQRPAQGRPDHPEQAAGCSGQLLHEPNRLL